MIYGLNQGTSFIKGIVDEIKISKKLTTEKEAQKSFFKNTESFYENIKQEDAKEKVPIERVISRQRENTQMLNEIEMQLKEMFTRSQNFETFLEKADLKKQSNSETD
jgi:hypothetical protein